MKRNLLKLALCAMAALPLGAWADNTWTFTWSDATKTNLAASVVTDYWYKDGAIFYYSSALANADLKYSDTNLAPNLKFTIEAGKCGFRSSALFLYGPTSGTTKLHLPSLSVGDVISITSWGSNYIKPESDKITGTVPTSGSDKQTYSYNVTEAGDSYTLTTTGTSSMYIESITITNSSSVETYSWSFTSLLSSAQQTEIGNKLAWVEWSTHGYSAMPVNNTELLYYDGSKVSETEGLSFSAGKEKVRIGTGGSYPNILIMQDGTKVIVHVQKHALVVFNSKAGSSAKATNFSGDTNTSTGLPTTAADSKRFVVTGDVTSCTFKTTGGSNLTSIQVLDPKVVTLSHNFATFSNTSGYDMEIKTDGVVAYAVTGKDGSGGVALEEYTNNVIPNGQGVILYSTSATSCIIGFTEEEPVSVSGNYLTAVTTDATSVTDGYVLAYNKTSGKIVFRKVNSTYSATLNADKAYLSSSIDVSPARLGSFTLPFDDETTGISNINAVSGEKQEYYTLQGTKVNQLSKGIYVVNGKKVIIK